MKSLGAPIIRAVGCGGDAARRVFIQLNYMNQPDLRVNLFLKLCLLNSYLVSKQTAPTINTNALNKTMIQSKSFNHSYEMAEDRRSASTFEGLLSMKYCCEFLKGLIRLAYMYLYCWPDRR
jgi:hypothetical protein